MRGVVEGHARTTRALLAAALVFMACRRETAQLANHGLPSSPTTANEPWTVGQLQADPQHAYDGVRKRVVGFVVEVHRPKEPPGMEGCLYPVAAAPPTAKQPVPPGVDCNIDPWPQMPHFWIADRKDETDRSKMIAVAGYFSSYIQQYLARRWYVAGHDLSSKVLDDLYLDNNSSRHVTVLNEPRVGARVIVHGRTIRELRIGVAARFAHPGGVIDAAAESGGKIDYLEGAEDVQVLR